MPLSTRQRRGCGSSVSLLRKSISSQSHSVRCERSCHRWEKAVEWLSFLRWHLNFKNVVVLSCVRVLLEAEIKLDITNKPQGQFLCKNKEFTRVFLKMLGAKKIHTEGIWFIKKQKLAWKTVGAGKRSENRKTEMCGLVWVEGQVYGFSWCVFFSSMISTGPSGRPSHYRRSLHWIYLNCGSEQSHGRNKTRLPHRATLLTQQTNISSRKKPNKNNTHCHP